MSTEKKAFKVVYGLIIDNLLTEKEAFNLVEGIFAKELIQIPVPILPDEGQQENLIEEASKQVEVKGFHLNN